MSIFSALLAPFRPRVYTNADIQREIAKVQAQADAIVAAANALAEQIRKQMGG